MATVGVAVLRCAGPGENGPKAEVAETAYNLELPAVPEFPDAKPYADGSHSVTEMRRKGAKYVGTKDLKITGFVVFKYDLDTCAREVGEKLVKGDPKLCDGKKDVIDCTAKVGQKSVADAPNQCDRPYFYLSDEPKASFEKSLWIVDVPRPLREDEKKDPATVDAFKKGPQPPTFAVGDKVTVQGDWEIKSPNGFGNSDGLLIYTSVGPAAAQ